MKLAAGVRPIPALLKLGVTVGLGTDGAASNNNLDLWGEMSLAARFHKVWGRAPTLMPAARVVALATREGTRVLGLGETAGTLTLGKAADLVVVERERPTSPPSMTPTPIWSMRPGPPTCDVSWWAAAGSFLTGSLQPWIGPPWPPPSGTTAGTWPPSAGNSGRRPELQLSTFDQTISSSRHNIIGQKRILEIPPQKVNFAIQIISLIS